MSSESQDHITIRLEVHIPTGGGGRPVVVTETAASSDGPGGGARSAVAAGRAPPPGPSRLRDHISGSSPSRGALYPVRAIGSGPGIGSICGWVTYPNCPTDVRAAACPSASYVPSATPTGVAVTGTPSPGNKLWTWSSANEIPGAGYSDAGVENVLAVWNWTPAGSGSGGGSWDLDEVTFYGLTGTSGPCGTSSGTSDGTTAPPAHNLATYPALWCVALSGFHADPLRPLNATWALRQASDTPSPTWDNAGDGTHSPLIRLRLCRTRGWELTLTLGPVEAGYALPFTGNTFGPLLFPAGLAHVPPSGPVPLPPVTVSAI